MDGEAPTRIGGYEILSEIARGGMGIVYKARQPGLDRLVALKVIVAGEHASIETIERFQREARAAARLEHPNVVQVFDVGQDGPCHFFTMQFVEGASVAALAKERRLSHRQAADPDVPYGLLVEAFWDFSWYAEEQTLPAVTLEGEGPVLGRSIPETAEMASMRGTIEALLDRARHARVWGKVAAADLTAALDAVRAIQTAEYARAEAGLSQAIASPDLTSFATALVLARAKVRYLTMDFERGLEDAAEVVRARPSSAYPRYFLAHLRLGRAATRAARGEDPRETLREASEACGEALSLKPA